jgi:flagellar hook-basal body complex protein FliE
MDSVKTATSFLLQQMRSNAPVQGASQETAEPESGQLLKSFGTMLTNQMEHLNTLQQDAGQSQQTYATGGEIELHNVILSAEKADLSLQLAMQIRNKIIDAYQEVSRMSI